MQGGARTRSRARRRLTNRLELLHKARGLAKGGKCCRSLYFSEIFDWRFGLEFGSSWMGGQGRSQTRYVAVVGRRYSEKTGGHRFWCLSHHPDTLFQAYFWAKCRVPAWICRAPATPPQEAQTANPMGFRRRVFSLSSSDRGLWERRKEKRQAGGVKSGKEKKKEREEKGREAEEKGTAEQEKRT